MYLPMHKNSFCHSKKKQPSIYIIAKDYYLYIGETQKSPITRWASHLSKQGSFMKNLTKADEDAACGDLEVKMISFQIDEIIDRCEEWEWKKVTQSIEHAVHLNVDQSAKIATKFYTISNTIRTAPSHAKYPWIRELAEQIVLQIEGLLPTLLPSEGNSFELVIS